MVWPITVRYHNSGPMLQLTRKATTYYASNIAMFPYKYSVTKSTNTALLRLTEIIAVVTVIASANYCNGATNLGQLQPRRQPVGTLYLTYSWNCMLYIKLSIPISSFWVLLEANLSIKSVSLMWRPRQLFGASVYALYFTWAWFDQSMNIFIHVYPVRWTFEILTNLIAKQM